MRRMVAVAMLALLPSCLCGQFDDEFARLERALDAGHDAGADVVDAGTIDAGGDGGRDGGAADASTDAGVHDAGASDAGALDGGGSDGGATADAGADGGVDPLCHAEGAACPCCLPLCCAQIGTITRCQDSLGPYPCID